MTYPQRICGALAALVVLLFLAAPPAMSKGGEEPSGKPPKELRQESNSGGSKVSGVLTVVVFPEEEEGFPVEAYLRLREGKKVSAGAESIRVFTASAFSESPQDPGTIQMVLENSSLAGDIIDAWFADVTEELEVVVTHLDEFALAEPPNMLIVVVDVQLAVRRVK